MAEILAGESEGFWVEEFQPEEFATQAVEAIRTAENYWQYTDSMFNALDPRIINKWLQISKSFAPVYGAEVGLATASFIGNNTEQLQGSPLGIFRHASSELINNADDHAVARLLHGSAKRVLSQSGVLDDSQAHKLHKRLY